MGYPPHLFGRYAVAAHRLDEQRRRSETLNRWVAANATFDGVKRFIGQTGPGRGRRGSEITPEQSRNAALGLARALGMKVGR